MEMVVFIALLALLSVVGIVFCIRDRIRRGASIKLDRTVADLARILRATPYEVMYIVDDCGELIFEATQYDTRRVHLSDREIAYLQSHPGSIGLHNHDTDVPPSVGDLLFAARTRQSCLIVVSPHYLYTVEPPESGWKTDQETNAAFGNLFYLFKVVDENQHFAGIASDGAILVETEYRIESTDAAIEALTDRLGYAYTREDI